VQVADTYFQVISLPALAVSISMTDSGIILETLLPFDDWGGVPTKAKPGSTRQILESEVAARVPTEPVRGTRCGARDLRISDRNASHQTPVPS